MIIQTYSEVKTFIDDVLLDNIASVECATIYPINDLESKPSLEIRIYTNTAQYSSSDEASLSS